MAECEVMSQSPDFKDRKVRLVVFGILQIILGSIFMLVTALTVFGVIMMTVHKNADVDARAAIPGVLFYILLAFWFVWMGIGSVMTRRWARALILVSSWLWLICGTLGFVFLLRFLPNMYDKMAENGQMPKAAVMAVECTVITIMGIFYIVIPGLLILFYSGRNVKATCERRDSKIRWTDKCPLPVLGISIVNAGWAVSMLWMAIYNWTVPFFGSILSGTSGAAATLALSLLLAYTAYGTYKLNMKAWWCALMIILGWSLSTIITFSCVSMQTYYDKMGFSGKQLESVKQYGDMFGSNMNLFVGLWAVVVIAYLVCIRKYFKSASQQDNL
jgi:MFS family permease